MRISSVFAGIFLVAVILSSCAPEHVVKNYAGVEDLTDAYCTQQAPEDKDDCFKALSIREGSVEFCKAISSQRTKAECQYEIAKVTENPKICDQITLYSVRVQCKDNVAAPTPSE